MFYNEYFKLQFTQDDVDFVIPYLRSDIPLCIDPFLLFKNKSKIHQDLHNRLLAFFDIVKQLAARGSKYDRDLLHLISFPEVNEIRLGYGHGDYQGRGCGEYFHNLILNLYKNAAPEIIEDIRHIEEFQLLDRGIAEDRISDITANILKDYLIVFTQQQVQKYGISQTKRMPVNHIFSFNKVRWEPGYFELPFNPLSETPILFVPRDIVVILPWIHFEGSYKNFFRRFMTPAEEVLFKKRDPLKEYIVQQTRERFQILKDYIDEQEQNAEWAKEYDVVEDPDSRVKIFKTAEAIKSIWDVSRIEKLKEVSEQSFESMCLDVIDQFKRHVEEGGTHEFLRKPSGDPLDETKIHILFRNSVDGFCHKAGIDMSHETDFGSGPVDFKFSSGGSHKAHIEIKKANSSKYKHGLEKQLPTYLRSDNVKLGLYVLILFSEKDLRRFEKLEQGKNDIEDKYGIRLHLIPIDARKRPSASRL